MKINTPHLKYNTHYIKWLKVVNYLFKITLFIQYYLFLFKFSISQNA